MLTTRPAGDWEDELNRIGVPSGAVLSLPEVLSHPQITERGLLARFDDTPGLDRAIDLMRIGAMIDGARPGSRPLPRRSAPTPRRSSRSWAIPRQRSTKCRARA